jgi:uncharacterized membrane protein
MDGGPDQPQRFVFPGQAEHHGGGHWITWILPVVFALLLAATFFWFVLQTRGGRIIGARPVQAVAAGDVALDELRLRYARGEVSREDFLAADADLRGTLSSSDI